MVTKPDAAYLSIAVIAAGEKSASCLATAKWSEAQRNNPNKSWLV